MSKNGNIIEAKKPEDMKYDDPFRLTNDDKKFGVYVKNPDTGNDILVKFGDPNMEIKRDDDEARKAFRARHNCSEKKDKTTAGYWSCKMWQSDKSVSDMLEVDLRENLIEGTVAGRVGADDGPSFLYPSHDRYIKASTEDLKKYIETGWKIVSHLIDDGTEQDIQARIYPDGPVGSVSFFPAGQLNKRTPMNQDDLFGSEAYDTWKKHTLDTIAKVGWKWVQTQFDFESEREASAGAKDIEKDSDEAEAKEKELEKTIKESVNFIEDSIKMLKESELNEGKGDLLYLIDQLENSMEYYDKNSFVNHISKQTPYKKEALRKIYDAYWEIPLRDKMSMGIGKGWVKWLSKFNISEGLDEPINEKAFHKPTKEDLKRVKQGVTIVVDVDGKHKMAYKVLSKNDKELKLKGHDGQKYKLPYDDYDSVVKIRENTMNEISSSRLQMDQRAVKRIYQKASGKLKSILDTAIKAHKAGKLERDYKLQDKVGDALWDYTYDIFSNAPDDEVFIEGDSIVDIIDTMSRVGESAINEAPIADFYKKNPHIEPAMEKLKTLKSYLGGGKFKFNSKTYADKVLRSLISGGIPAEQDGNMIQLKFFKEDVKESSYPYTDKIEALNDFFNGKISAEKLKSIADDVFGRPVATKKELEDFVNNKFLQGVMADSYNISPTQLVKKVKELLKLKVYEGIDEIEKDSNDPCWEGYVQLGTKEKDGKEVPNCVPMKEALKESTEYQNFFKKAMEKFGVKSPADFESEDEKKEFFDYVDKNWKADDEVKESLDEGIVTIALGVAGAVLLLKILKVVVKVVLGGIGMMVKLPKDKLKDVVTETTMEYIKRDARNSMEAAKLQHALNSAIDDGDIRTIKDIVMVIQKLKDNGTITMVEGVITEATKSYSINEGKKRFKQQDGIGKSKYTVSYHDGKKKNKDGSDFFDIKIFKNKKELEAFKKDLVSKGFVSESINEGFMKMDGDTLYVDSDFLNLSNKAGTLKHLGMGDFELKVGGGGTIEFMRVSKSYPSFTGRAHKVKGSKDDIKKMLQKIPKGAVKESTNEDDMVRLVKGREWDIGASNHSTGTMFYNRKEEEHGDYKKLALVDKKGKITYYDKKLPSFITKYIEQYAKSKKNEEINEKTDTEKFYNATVKFKHGNKEITGDVVRMDGGKLRIDIGNNKYVVKSPSEVKIVESINETKFYVWYDKKKEEIEADSLYKAKEKFIKQNKVPMSKWSRIAIKSAGSMKAGDFRFEIKEGRAFISAAKKAKDEGLEEFEFNGKTYPVTIKESLLRLTMLERNIEEAVTPSKTMQKVMDIVKEKQYKKIGGSIVDFTTANWIKQIYDMGEDRHKEKLNKMNIKQLAGLAHKVASRKESIEEATEASDTLNAIFRIANSKKEDTVDGVKISPEVALSIGALWDNASGSNKEKISKLSAKELIGMLRKMLKR